MSDFRIVDGVLKAYTGPGGNVVVPDGILSIGYDVSDYRFRRQVSRRPDSVTSIGDEAF